MNQLHQAELKVKTLLLPVIQIVKGAQHDLEIARDLLFAEEHSGARGAGTLVGGDLQQLSLLAAELGHQGVAQVANDLPGQGLRAVSGVEQIVQLSHHRCALTRSDRLQQVLKDGIGHRAHQLANLDSGENGAIVRVDGGRGDGLVHDAERVAHRSVAGLGQQGQRGFFRFDIFLRCNHLELREDVVELDGVKAEMLTARSDGLRNIFRFRRCHHEDDVRGRLFKRLEQGIEGGLGDLVRFIKDVNLVAVAGGRVAGGVAEFANLVDTAIGGCVDFDHIDGVALADFNAGVADTAGLGRRPLC